MRYIKPAKVDGVVAAPPSKSMMQRAVAMALLAEGTTEILNPTYCDDAEAALAVAEALGSTVSRSEALTRIAAGKNPAAALLNCGESGLCLRMFAAIAGLYPAPMTLTGIGSLLKRPVSFIEKPLVALGAEVRTSGGYLPVHLRGPLRGGVTEVDCSISSQFLSGLLIALPTCELDSALLVKDLKSRPYVALTLEMLAKSGIQIGRDASFEQFSIPGRQSYAAGRINIEGDWSGASLFLVAGAIAGRVEVHNLNPQSTQADLAILDALVMAGARVRMQDESVTVEHDRLRAFEFDASDCPDLFPPLVALAVNCEGTTKIYGAGRLEFKESNRAATLAEEFGRLGIKIAVDQDRMTIEGGRSLGGQVFSHNDHRIAMALAVAALAGKQGLELEDEICVRKSFPSFFTDLDSLAGKTEPV